MYQWFFFWLDVKFAPKSDDRRRFNVRIYVVSRCCPAQAIHASLAPAPCSVLVKADAIASSNVIW